MADIDTNLQIEFLPHPTDPRFQNLTGNIYGRLTVLGYAGGINVTEKRPNGYSAWLCRCSCETIKVAEGSKLKSGVTTSCGCFQKEQSADRMTTHGATRKDAPPERRRAHKVYSGQKGRCNNPNHPAFKNYGARGIEVKYSFTEFEESLPEGGIPEGMEIDREQNEGNYSVDNIRLVDRFVQSNNRRNNVRITYNGKEQTLAQWCRELGKDYYATRMRLNKYGWCVKCAFEIPPKGGVCNHRSK